MEEQKKHVLLVEDDENIAEGVVTLLELEHFQVTHTPNLHQTEKFLAEQVPHLILLDIGLPDGNGLDFCLRICGQDVHPPVVMLTSKTDEDSVVKGLENGATDYVKKPFGNKELLARVRAVLREKTKKETIISYHDLQINLEKRIASYQKNEMALDRRQFDILHLFVESAERVLTREKILDHLKGSEDISDRTIDSHVSHIRKILKKNGIEELKISSVYGVGYRFEKK